MSAFSTFTLKAASQDTTTLRTIPPSQSHPESGHLFGIRKLGLMGQEQTVCFYAWIDD